MKSKIKLSVIFFLLSLYITLSIIKFCTIKVLQYDAPITEIYFAPNLCKENKFTVYKGFILYNYRYDYSNMNPKAKKLLQKDEFYDPIYDFFVGPGWLIISVCLIILLFFQIIKKTSNKASKPTNRSSRFAV